MTYIMAIMLISTQLEWVFTTKYFDISSGASMLAKATYIKNSASSAAQRDGVSYMVIVDSDRVIFDNKTIGVNSSITKSVAYVPIEDVEMAENFQGKGIINAWTISGT